MLERRVLSTIYTKGKTWDWKALDKTLVHAAEAVRQANSERASASQSAMPGLPATASSAADPVGELVAETARMELS